jgi:hypothetical protein
MAHPKKKKLKIEAADRAAVDYIIAAVNIAGDRLRSPGAMQYASQSILGDVVSVLKTCEREHTFDINPMLYRLAKDRACRDLRPAHRNGPVIPQAYCDAVQDIARLALWAVTPNTVFGTVAADLKQLIKILEDKV